MTAASGLSPARSAPGRAGIAISCLAGALAALGAALALPGSASAATLKPLTVSPAHPVARWHGSKSFSGEPCASDSACDTQPFELKGVTRRWLRHHYGVLHVSISWKDHSDTYTLELDKASDGSYIRSSEAATDALPKNPLVQSVGIHLMAKLKFTRSFSALVVPGQSHGGYRGKIRLADERARWLYPRAGFRLRDLSLASQGPTLGAGEPSIAFGPTTINVTAPASTPAVAGSRVHEGVEPERGVIYFRSLDGGRHWTAGNIGSELGGGDSDVVVDPDRGTYVEDLALAPSTIFLFKSVDQGSVFSPEPPFNADADREWLATYMPSGAQDTSEAVLYTVYHGLANQEPFLCLSTNGGTTNVCQPGITDPQVQVDATGNTDQGNVVVEKDGDADFLFATSTAAENADPNNPSPGTGPLHNLYLGHYNARTGTITDHLVYRGKEGHWITGLFPVLAIDSAGNLYASWPESPSDAARHASGPWKLKLSHSTDGGRHWSAPVVMNPPKLRNNLLNWITAGGRGKVDIIWAGTTARSNEYDARARWRMFFAQSTDALSSSPHFTYRQITPHPIRYGNVCVLGLFCPADDSRSLLDFAQVELDSRCRANVVFGNNARYIPALLRRNQIFRGDGTATDFARQGSRGARICHGGGQGGAGSYDFGG